MIESKALRLLSEEPSWASPFAVLIAKGEARVSRYYTIKQCFSRDSRELKNLREIFQRAKYSNSLLRGDEGVPAFTLSGEGDYFSSSGGRLIVPFLVQPYIQGRTLLEVGEQKVRLAEARVVVILRELLEALLSLHYKGLAALVISPEAIKLEEGTDKATFVHLDYAAPVHTRAPHKQSSGEFLFTIPHGLSEFVAPEVSRGEGTFQADQYGLAASFLYAFGVRRGRGESWSEAARRCSFPTLRNLLSIMVAEEPRKRFGSIEAALSHLDHYCTEEEKGRFGEDDLLDEMELELMGTKRPEALIPPTQKPPVQLHREENWLRNFFGGAPQVMSATVDTYGVPNTPRSSSRRGGEFLRFVVLALVGLSSIYFFKYLESLINGQEREPPKGAPTRDYTSRSLRQISVNGVSFTVPREALVVESGDEENGSEVTATLGSSTLKFSTWRLPDNADLGGEADEVLELVGKGIFRFSRITSISHLQKTREGYSYRDFRAQGDRIDYLTRVILIAPKRVISMSTKASGDVPTSFAIERIRFIESLSVESLAAQ